MKFEFVQCLGLDEYVRRLFLLSPFFFKTRVTYFRQLQYLSTLHMQVIGGCDLYPAAVDNNMAIINESAAKLIGKVGEDALATPRTKNPPHQAGVPNIYKKVIRPLLTIS